MDFLDNIAGLVNANVEFNNNDELETLVENYGNAVAGVAKAGIEFGTLAGESEATNNAGKSLIDLAGEIGKAFPHLQPEQADRFKQIVGNVYDNPDPAVDASAQQLFDKAVDAVVAAQALSDYVNAQPTGGGEQ